MKKVATLDSESQEKVQEIDHKLAQLEYEREKLLAERETLVEGSTYSKKAEMPITPLSVVDLL